MERLKGALNQSQRRVVDATRAAERSVDAVRSAEMSVRREKEEGEKMRQQCVALQAKLQATSKQVSLNVDAGVRG